MLTVWFAIARAVHFAGCLSVLGVCFMEAAIVAPLLHDADPARRWRRIVRALLVPALPVALLSGIGWLAVVAINMSGLPPDQALRPDVLGLVLNQTEFGTLWRLRGALWLATAVCTVPMILRRRNSTASRSMTWIATAFAAGLVGSLAWSGHGQTGGPPALHLAADVEHLLAAACWPTGLLPLAILLWDVRRSGNEPPELARVIRRFSTMSLFAVAVLLLTGVLNSVFLVDSIAALFHSPYGQLLMIKIGLFCVTVAIGAVNLLVWKPRLMTPLTSSHARPIGKLMRNVALETILAALILAATGLLGVLEPAAHHHHHHSMEDATAENLRNSNSETRGIPLILFNRP